jgi:hypothetical protein
MVRILEPHQLITKEMPVTEILQGILNAARTEIECTVQLDPLIPRTVHENLTAK